MCGIIGCVGIDGAAGRVLEGLKRLEYRGYDSAGLALQNGGDLDVRKRAGKISQLEAELATDLPETDLGIGHTRWSTHGPPTDANSHPHTSYSGTVALVHNGIISNHEQLRRRCRERGYRFSSDTDTEVIAHLIEHHLNEGAPPDTAVRRAVAELEGSFAIAAIINDVEGLYAARQGSPLVLGIDDGGHYVASDAPAFIEHTDRVVYLEDGDMLRVTADDYEFLEQESRATDRTVKTLNWDADETEKGPFDHYMEKEIHDQPHSLRKTIHGRIDEGTGDISFDALEDGQYADIEEVHLVACGTSYHAARYAVRLLHKRDIPAQAFRASSYDGQVPVDGDTLAIGVSQSGETADTLRALRVADEQRATTLAVTNVVGSTVSRETDRTIYIRAGPEIGVAATKTFSSQVVTLSMLTEHLATDIPGAAPIDDLESFVGALKDLPEQIDRIVSRSRVRDLCERHHDQEEFFFIGHGVAHPVALEGALKFKEITYQHAEGFASGELKHGPLALVTDDVPVFTIFTGGDDERTKINAEEAQTRGAEIVAIADDQVEADFADERITIPRTHPDLSGLLANVQLQLVAYHAARLLDRPIDKPRNLAKSVTVT